MQTADNRAFTPAAKTSPLEQALCDGKARRSEPRQWIRMPDLAAAAVVG
jgi:hypothetical protein